MKGRLIDAQSAQTMRLYVANTDYDWYQYLLGLTADPGEPDEVNFWRPSGRQVVKLAYGDLFVFKLKKEHAHAIVGFGLWVAYVRLSVQEAWDTFGRKNGAPTRDHVWRRIVQYVPGLASTPTATGRGSRSDANCF